MSSFHTSVNNNTKSSCGWVDRSNLVISIFELINKWIFLLCWQGLFQGALGFRRSQLRKTFCICFIPIQRYNEHVKLNSSDNFATTFGLLKIIKDKPTNEWNYAWTKVLTYCWMMTDKHYSYQKQNPFILSNVFSPS